MLLSFYSFKRFLWLTMLHFLLLLSKMKLSQLSHFLVAGDKLCYFFYIIYTSYGTLVRSGCNGKTWLEFY